VQVVDTNVLVYAHRRDCPDHDRAKAWLTDRVLGSEAWAITWSSIHEFIGVVTNARIWREPTPLDHALQQVRAWLGSCSCRVLGEPDGYLEVLAQVLSASSVTGAKIHDARIFAIAKAHGARELLTCDRDFSRFGGLCVRNPLLAAQSSLRSR
jgi:uncharacterized protein